MKAVRIHQFGGPDVLQVEDLPMPEPGPGEMRIQVMAAGVNPVDWKIRKGFGGPPLPLTMGLDVAGVVDKVGPGVEMFHTGDRVFGEAMPEYGGYTEYTLVKTSQVAQIPKSLDFVQAAAIPIAGITAWQALFDAGGLRAGQRVLIHGAAGGVGSFAVQFAKWKGAYVIGTASGKHIGFVESLGADLVIDYGAGGAGLGKVVLEIVRALLRGERGEMGTEGDALGDGGEAVQFQRATQFRLPGKDQGERGTGIDIEIAEEANFLEHGAPEQMRFVNDDDGLLAGVVALLQGTVELPPGVATVEAGCQTELPERLEVEVARGELRVGDIERRIARDRQAGEEGP